MDQELIIRGDFTIEPMPDNCVKRLKYAVITTKYRLYPVIDEFKAFDEQEEKGEKE